MLARCVVMAPDWYQMPGSGCDAPQAVLDKQATMGQLAVAVLRIQYYVVLAWLAWSD